jgi:hypothetical protein
VPKRGGGLSPGASGLRLDCLRGIGQAELGHQQPVEPGDAHPAGRHGDPRRRKPVGERVQRIL